MEFNQQSSATGNRELIPGGTLAWGILTVKGMKVGKVKEDGTPGSRFAECELTIDEGQYTRRKIFTNVGDPEYANNTDEYKKMGYGALSRMLEASGLVNAADPNSYSRVNGQSFDTLMMWLDGKRVAFKVKLSKGRDGYPDKNEVGEFLSPNPISSSSKDFQKLVAQGSAPTAHPVATAPAAGAWVNAANSGQAAGDPSSQAQQANPAPVQQAVMSAGQPAAAAWLQQAQAGNNPSA